MVHSGPGAVEEAGVLDEAEKAPDRDTGNASHQASEDRGPRTEANPQRTVPGPPTRTQSEI
ncbi:hypothetical protein C8T65DRAFT_659300 [Cerioporus squamosus]|nr:hypothetical protein C8T65DRAFT_659300 [Cerioporus squamosus]